MNEAEQTEAAPIPPLPRRLARRGLIALAVAAALAAIFHLEENWRGRRAWESSRKALESRQEVLDWAAYVPAAVADDQNFFKAPMMREWFVGDGTNGLAARLSLDSFQELARRRGNTNDTEWVAEWLLRSGGDGAANSGDSPPERLETFKFDGLSPGNAIRQLARAAGLRVQIDPQVDSGTAAPVTGAWSNVTAQAALLALLCNNNLRWVDDPTNTGAGIIKVADPAGQAGAPDPANIVLGMLQKAVGPSGNASEGFPLAADLFQQRGPIRLSVAADSIPAKGQMARLFPGAAALRVEPDGNALRVTLGQAPIAAAD